MAAPNKTQVVTHAPKKQVVSHSGAKTGSQSMSSSTKSNTGSSSHHHHSQHHNQAHGHENTKKTSAVKTERYVDASGGTYTATTVTTVVERVKDLKISSGGSSSKDGKHHHSSGSGSGSRRISSTQATSSGTGGKTRAHVSTNKK